VLLGSSTGFGTKHEVTDDFCPRTPFSFDPQLRTLNNGELKHTYFNIPSIFRTV